MFFLHVHFLTFSWNKNATTTGNLWGGNGSHKLADCPVLPDAGESQSVWLTHGHGRLARSKMSWRVVFRIPDFCRGSWAHEVMRQIHASYPATLSLTVSLFFFPPSSPRCGGEKTRHEEMPPKEIWGGFKQSFSWKFLKRTATGRPLFQSRSRPQKPSANWTFSNCFLGSSKFKNLLGQHMDFFQMCRCC